MTNKMTSVRGRIRLNAATPSAGTSTIRISSVPYAEEEIPSGDSTPSASGLDSRCSPRSWLTSGGPSSRRLVEYQNVSGGAPLLSSSAAAFRVATGLRLSSATSHWAPETSYHHIRRGVTAARAPRVPGVVVAYLGRSTRYMVCSPAPAVVTPDGVVISRTCRED